jgi:hypothetical protein
MERLQRYAVILSLVEHMEKEGSWCGETHIQKACFLLEELFEVSLGFEFILYKHGPYSFDLNDELTAMRADIIFKLQSTFSSYGPSFRPARNSKQIKEMYHKTIETYETRVKFVAQKVGSNGVSYLERLATALYVTRYENTNETAEGRSKIIHALKPHVTIEEAREATKTIDLIMKEASKVKF